MNQTIYTIRDLENLSGVKSHTIRTWERRYGFFSPDRSKTNIRYYSREDLKRLVQVSHLKNSGIRFNRLMGLSRQELENMFLASINETTNSTSELSTLISLIFNKNIEGLELFLEIKLTELSPEDFVLDVLEPLSNRLGLVCMLHTGPLYFEKLIMNRIFTKIIQLSDRLRKPNVSSREILIFNSDQDFVPLRLALVYFIAAMKNYKINFIFTYLDPSSLLEMKNEISADVVYTEFNNRLTKSKILEYVNAMENAFPSAKNIVSGNEIEKYWKYVPNKVYSIRNLEVLQKTL